MQYLCFKNNLLYNFCNFKIYSFAPFNQIILNPFKDCLILNFLSFKIFNNFSNFFLFNFLYSRNNAVLILKNYLLNKFFYYYQYY